MLERAQQPNYPMSKDLVTVGRKNAQQNHPRGEATTERRGQNTNCGRVDKSLWRAVLACKHVRIEKRSGEKSSLY